MTIGKITISKEQAEAIEKVLKMSDGDKSEIIDKHSEFRHRDGGWRIANTESLNELSQAVLARALLIGYDVEPEFKVGEWVVDKIGNIGKVTKVENRQVWGHWNNGSTIEQYSAESTTRHATPEEIKAEKERQLWEKIGRNVGEFKVGDVGVDIIDMVRRGKKIIELSYKEGKLKGFYPAESFISFEEGEEE